MTSTFEIPDPFVIESVQHIDWYDGPVTALLSERSTGPWLAFLLASLRRPYRRIYGLLPTTAEVAEELARILEDEPSSLNWSCLSKRFHVALANSDGPLLLVRGEGLHPPAPLERCLLSWNHFRGRVTFTDDDAYSQERAKFWNEVFDDPPDEDER
ncbi:MAG: hypothetical protein H6719_15030 [Sandaracinaceae bacterium]|nr:hypothetical protein [Sandaracinaceae bacterium]